MRILETSFSFFFSRLHTNEHVHAHEDIAEKIEEDVDSITEVKDEWEKYEKAIERVALLFKHSAKSPETLHIAKLDTRRGTLWRVGKQLVKIALDSSDAAIRAAAEDLSILVNNTYGDVPRFSLYGETGSLKHAIADFRATENEAKVALINGLPGIINELEDVNKELETLYHKRLEEAEAIRQLGTLADNLKYEDKLLAALFDALNTVYDYNGRTAKNPVVAATIEGIATKVEGLFAQLRSVIARRGKTL